MRRRRVLEVVATGPLTTVQDLGRPAGSHLGVGPSGAADRGALRLANRLLGNDEGAAALEVTLGGLVMRPLADVLVTLTGAPCPASVDGRPVAAGAVVHVRAGHELRLGPPVAGLRTYVAVRGGVDVEPVLGSRSTDLLAGLGPAPLAPGDRVPVGPAPEDHPVVDAVPLPPPPAGDVVLRAVPGPRDRWLTDVALRRLFETPWEVTSESNRVGVRFAGPALERHAGELPSEGVVRGAVQVPPSGLPTMFLADHPVTGGYPVAAVVVDEDVDLAAQVRPGQRVRLRRVSPPGWVYG